MGKYLTESHCTLRRLSFFRFVILIPTQGGAGMDVYLDLVVLLNFLIDLLLLMAADRLSGYSIRLWRTIGSALRLAGVSFFGESYLAHGKSFSDGNGSLRFECQCAKKECCVRISIYGAWGDRSWYGKRRGCRSCCIRGDTFDDLCIWFPR